MIKTVVEESAQLSIPIRIRNGEMRYFYGDKLPKMKDGAIAQIIIDANFIEDDYFKGSYLSEEEVLLLDKDSEVLVEVNLERVPDNFKAFVIRFEYGAFTLVGVSVYLAEDLKMIVKGDKNPSLMPCKCKIALLDLEVDSINQAHTFIIQRLQENRKSHSANAFQRTYIKEGDYYFQLDEIRDSKLAKFECRLVLDNDILY